MRTNLASAALAMVALASGSPPVSAAPLEPKAAQVLFKSFTFLLKRPGPGARIIITHGAADPASVQSAFPAFQVREGTPIDAAGAFAVIVVDSAEAQTARQANNNAMIVSSSVDCVTSGACMIAIEVEPKVVFYVSRAASQAAGIEFDHNFKMLVTEK